MVLQFWSITTLYLSIYDLNIFGKTLVTLLLVKYEVHCENKSNVVRRRDHCRFGIAKNDLETKMVVTLLSVYLPSRALGSSPLMEKPDLDKPLRKERRLSSKIETKVR